MNLAWDMGKDGSGNGIGKGKVFEFRSEDIYVAEGIQKGQPFLFRVLLR